MRLVSFRSSDGRLGFGPVSDDGDAVLDLSTLPDLAGARGLAEALARLGLTGLAALAGSAAAARLRLADLALLPPVTDCEKILCVGLNYRGHAEEAGLPVPERPAIFVRFVSSLAGSGQPVVAPSASAQFDYEGELAVVIGRRGWRVPRTRALDWVLGYTCFADNSVRDWQTHSRQATAGKNFPRSGAMGPWITTADSVGDPGALLLVTRVGGREVQRATTADMVFGVEELVSYASEFCELLPGDVIATGTPAGVGMSRRPPAWLRPGDSMEVEIERVGILKNAVVAEQPEAGEVAQEQAA